MKNGFIADFKQYWRVILISIALSFVVIGGVTYYTLFINSSPIDSLLSDVTSDSGHVISESEAQTLNNNLKGNNKEFEIYTNGVTFSSSVLQNFRANPPTNDPTSKIHLGLLMYHGVEFSSSGQLQHVVYLVDTPVRIWEEGLKVYDIANPSFSWILPNPPPINITVLKIINGIVTPYTLKDHSEITLNDCGNHLRIKNKKPQYTFSFFHYKQVYDLINGYNGNIKISLGEGRLHAGIYGPRQLHTIISKWPIPPSSSPAAVNVLDRNWPPSSY